MNKAPYLTGGVPTKVIPTLTEIAERKGGHVQRLVLQVVTRQVTTHLRLRISRLCGLPARRSGAALAARLSSSRVLFELAPRQRRVVLDRAAEARGIFARLASRARAPELVGAKPSHPVELAFFLQRHTSVWGCFSLKHLKATCCLVLRMLALYVGN